MLRSKLTEEELDDGVFKTLFESSTTALSINDFAGKVIMANYAFCKLLRRSHAEVKATSFRELASINTFNKKQARILIHDINTHGQTIIQCDVLFKDGSFTPMEIISSVFIYKGEKLLQTSLRDISILKEAHDEAVEANQAKTSFLATMSHEIRTPLNGIIGYTDHLLEQDFKEEDKNSLRIIKNSSNILLNIINDILDFSKIEKGEIQLEKAPFSLHNCINGAIEVYQQTALNKGIQLNFDIQPGISPYIMGDIGKLQQTFLNLISNGVKFTSKGSVTLKAEKENEETLKFTVSDSGVGFNETFKQNIFNPFTQEDASISRKYGGSGLGLSICKQVITHMGGEIEADSIEGNGSTFTVTIPYIIASDPESSDTSPQGENEVEVKNKLTINKVLLVEDNPINVMLGKYILAQMELSLDIAENGKDALDLMNKITDYDAVIMDIQMPIMDGLEATAHIREGKVGTHYQDIPIIAMTANAFPEDRETYLKAGMNHFIPKPIDKNLLKDTLYEIP